MKFVVFAAFEVEFRGGLLDVDTKKNKVVEALLRYELTAMRNTFGKSSVRSATMNQFASAINTLNTDFQHRDPCNIGNIKATLENVSSHL